MDCFISGLEYVSKTNWKFMLRELQHGCFLFVKLRRSYDKALVENKGRIKTDKKYRSFKALHKLLQILCSAYL